MTSREPSILDGNLGSNIVEVEEQINLLPAELDKFLDRKQVQPCFCFWLSRITHTTEWIYPQETQGPGGFL